MHIINIILLIYNKNYIIIKLSFEKDNSLKLYL